MHWKAVGKPTKRPKGCRPGSGGSRPKTLQSIGTDPLADRLASGYPPAVSEGGTTKPCRPLGQGSSLAYMYGNPLDDIDPVSALVPHIITVKWL
jgi:hypothetical protein